MSESSSQSHIGREIDRLLDPMGEETFNIIKDKVSTSSYGTAILPRDCDAWFRDNPDASKLDMMIKVIEEGEFTDRTDTIMFDSSVNRIETIPGILLRCYDDNDTLVRHIQDLCESVKAGRGENIKWEDFWLADGEKARTKGLKSVVDHDLTLLGKGLGCEGSFESLAEQCSGPLTRKFRVAWAKKKGFDREQAEASLIDTLQRCAEESLKPLS